MVQKIQDKQLISIDIVNLRTLILKIVFDQIFFVSVFFFFGNTLAHDDASEYQGWLLKPQQFRRYEISGGLKSMQLP